MDKKLLSHYGKAIFEYALDNNILENVKEELSLVNETLNDNVDLQKFLSSPLIPINEKNEKIENIFSKYISKDTLSYLLILAKRKGFSKFDVVYSSFIHLYNEKNGILEGKLYTAFELSDVKVKEIENVLSKKEKKEVVLAQIHDPHLIGGVRIYLDNKIYDYSIEKKINEIKDSLLKIKEQVI